MRRSEKVHAVLISRKILCNSGLSQFSVDFMEKITNTICAFAADPSVIAAPADQPDPAQI